MKNITVKKVVIIAMIIMVITAVGSYTLGTGHSNGPELQEIPTAIEGNTTEDGIDDSAEKEEPKQEKEISQASEDILDNVTKREKRIAELTDKYNDAVYGKVAYYLEVAQKYSLPICFIGIAMGAFNFLIIGNKKLDKKEQGFGWIVGFTIGLVVFNVIPLIFALIVAAR